MKDANWDEVRTERNDIIHLLQRTIDDDREVSALENGVEVRWPDGSIITWTPTIKDGAR